MSLFTHMEQLFFSLRNKTDWEAHQGQGGDKATGKERKKKKGIFNPEEFIRIVQHRSSPRVKTLRIEERMVQLQQEVEVAWLGEGR